MEISWRHGLNDYTMPFMISYLSQQSATIEQLKKDNDERKAREASQKKDDDNTPILGGRLMLTQGPAGAAPSPGPYGQTNGITPQPTGFPRAF
jgi:clathrin heavy chain